MSTDVMPSRARRRGSRIVIEGESFTVRGILVGLGVGTIITFSNMYFGLQTGWVSTMTMPSSLLGYGFFKMLSRHLAFPFSPVENVLVQTVAGSMAIMPLGCGFVGVLPAMNYLLSKEEGGRVNLELWKLIIWSLGLCYFGVVFAVPLRRQVIIREKLKFPSGFSTAVLISVLHGTRGSDAKTASGEIPETFASLAAADAVTPDPFREDAVAASERWERKQEWKANVRLLLICFLISGAATVAQYFLPALRNLPIMGTVAAEVWLWTLNPSLAYVGQGIIMGPATTLHMLLGAVVGWGILSPLAKYRGWAPGSIDDWETGSKGWIVWVSLAIMLADAIISLGLLALRSAWVYLPDKSRITAIRPLRSLLGARWLGYTSVSGSAPRDDADNSSFLEPASPLSDFAPIGSAPPSVDGRDIDTVLDDDPLQNSPEHIEEDAPLSQQISNRMAGIGLAVSIAFCIICIHIVFGDQIPLYATVAAVPLALLLSIMGVRALGETDLNPVSGISKLAQLFFAVIVPQNHKSSVLINLVAGAVSEAGALQAGDLMQDIKTGHLLGAAPSAQFWGQMIGATVGAIASSLIYQLYTTVYTIPSDLFQVPTAYVWILMARLVTGTGLPPMAEQWAMGAALLFAVLTAVRIFGAGKTWQAYIPGGIAVAVGMYNVPSFTLARTIGGLIAWYWRSVALREDKSLIILASGFILGEGFLSIASLIMQSMGVPHL